MAKESYHVEKFKGYSWDYVIKSMEGIGWNVERNDGKLKVLTKKDLKMSVVRVDKNKWKFEIFKKNKIVDGLGINNDPSTKILVCEFGVLWGVPA